VTVIVASNRVARAKSDEPVAGGLATALIPMVKDSGAIWVGSSGQTADAAHTKDSFARIEALGSGAWQRSTYRRSTITAFMRASPILLCGRRCIRVPISSA